MNVAAILFAVAAVTGIAIAFIRLSGRDLPPMGLATCLRWGWRSFMGSSLHRVSLP
jgi:uncharacterized membrane protein YjjB (DUF3815 family)